MLASCPGKVIEKKPEVKKVEKKIEKKKIVPIKKSVYKPATPKHNRCTSPSGKVWNHGEGASYYTSKTVPYGSTCKKIQIVCGYGSLRK